jgi:Kdo2-lipid IVA lauroyltransferase/acyltransferase
MLKLVRRLDVDWSSDAAAGLLRRIGPWMPEHRIGRANLRAAFPEKSDAELEQILRGVWDNLGRVAAEYAHLDRVSKLDPDNPQAGRIDPMPETTRRFLAVREQGGPSLLFAAHLANWEIPAVFGAQYQIPAAVLYRAPNIGDVADAINRIRAVNMGMLVPASPAAPLQLAGALEQGRHVGMLVDQHFGRGVEVTFFGRKCMANPLIARLARNFECPIRGVRVVRLPNRRLTGELTEPIEPARDAAGRIEVAGTMQIITSIVENWVREHPDQWLWLHRRWR